MTGSGNEITQLAEEFASCRRTLLALGDENRQHLILEMMQMKDCRGVRVGKITQKPIFPARRYPIICAS